MVMFTFNLLGEFEINVDCLREPPENYKIRQTKEWYVKFLAKTMKEDSDHLTAPFIVLTDVTKATFDDKKINDYYYEVIGGVHRYNAIKAINSSGMKIKKQKCVVYGPAKSMGKELILVLAQQHNSLNQIQRVTTFPETCAICRRLLFQHFGGEDDGASFPQIPRYNTKNYRDWKSDCLLYTVNPRMVSK